MTIIEFFEKHKEQIQASNENTGVIGDIALTISGQLLETLYPQIIHLDEFKNVKHFEIISDQEYEILLSEFYKENGAPQINYIYVPGEDEDGVPMTSLKMEMTPKFEEYKTYKVGTEIPKNIRVKQIEVYFEDFINRSTMSSDAFIRLKVLEEVEKPNLDIMRVNTFNPIASIN